MRTGGILGGVVSLALIATPGAMAQAPPGEVTDAEASRSAPVIERGLLPADPESARIRLKLSGVKDGDIGVGKRVKVIGKVFPFVPDQNVRVALTRGKQTVKRRNVAIRRVAGSDVGRFTMTSKRVIKPGTYRFRAKKSRTEAQQGAYASTNGVGVAYPDLDQGDSGEQVRLFNELLAKRAYYTAKGSGYGSATGRAVLAFRKVNNMTRTTNATKGIYKTLAAGRGGFKLKWPGGGKHVEVDLSRQVMALAKNGKAKHIFHISSGAPATPTVRGKFKTYRKDYGTNSLGMIHSVYFIRGYATHGYHSVPTYPASHGCVRNPPPNALFIYKWIDMGDVFYVYG